VTKLKSRLGERPDQKQQPDNITKPTIKTRRDYRFLLALLGGEASTYDLLHSVGAMNIWEECRQMRKKGWDIETLRKPFIDRDGRKNPAGFYRLNPEQRPLALEVIAGWKP
jgi:hypothetical protein